MLSSVVRLNSDEVAILKARLLAGVAGDKVSRLMEKMERCEADFARQGGQAFKHRKWERGMGQTSLAYEQPGERT